MNTNVTYQMALERTYDILFGGTEVYEHAEALSILISRLYGMPVHTVQYDLFKLQGKQ